VPWQRQQQNLDEFPNLKRWFYAIQGRPATAHAYAKGDEVSKNRATVTEEGKKILFGQTSAKAQKNP
jgi:GST-like protein